MDALFRRGNPSNGWTRQQELTLTVDLLIPSINQVGVGSAADKFSFLGRSTDKSKTPLIFEDLGLTIDYEDDGTISGFHVVWADPYRPFSAFAGVIQLNNSTISRAALLNELGEPYWRDQDEDEILCFYEFPTHEITVEQALDETIRSIVVTTYPLMADAEQRTRYGVDKPWPPY